MATDFERIFEALDRGAVRFVVVGGVAVVLHGYPRLTADLDLVLSLERENVLRALEALGSLGYRSRAPVDAKGLADPITRQSWIEDKGLLVFTLWSPALPATEIDLFVTEPRPFEDLVRDAVVVPVAGVSLPVASIGDIITMKTNTGRSKDSDDVEALRAIRREQEKK